MSVNYATGLSEYANKGVCGLPEKFDHPSELERKVDELCKLIRCSKHTVVHTGAGISTSSGIPDFRGPNGVWTLEKQGLKPDTNVPFECAVPSIAHQILVELERRNLIHYLITQNIDGLHFRSGFPRNRLSILHGDMFLENCNTCGTLFARNVPSTTMGLRRTDVSCSFVKPSNRTCRGKICDSILDWESDLPYLDYNRAMEESKLADLHICIGTSLQMYPAASLPLLSARTKGSKLKRSSPSSMVIINLQTTKLDKHAKLVIHAPADSTMSLVARAFRIPTPPVHLSVTDPFKPSLVLRSLHSNPLEPVLWRILPHPVDGNSLEIYPISPPSKFESASPDPSDLKQLSTKPVEEEDEKNHVTACSDLSPIRDFKKFKSDVSDLF